MTLRVVHMAGENDDEAESYLTNLGKCFADAKRAYLAEPAHPLDLYWLQSGKHLAASRLDDRLCRCRHGCSQAIDSAPVRSPLPYAYSLPRVTAQHRRATCFDRGLLAGETDIAIKSRYVSL
jgi:hypothetical protein